MERIESLISNKRQVFQTYQQGLRNVDGIFINPEPPNTLNGFWMPTVVFSKDTRVTRERLQEAFRKENADARVFFWPLSGMDFFPSVNNPVATDIPGRAINLPSHHEISNTEQQRVIQVLKAVLHEY
jgi:perosamine synthetase